MKLKSLNKLGFMLMSLGIIVLIALTLRAITPATQSLPLRDVSPLKAAIPALDSPRDRVMAAWDQAREAGAYDFSADILQKTIPLPSPTNVGRTSKTERLHLEGHTNLPGRTMQLTLWTEGGNILDAHSGLEVKVEDERVLARQGSGDWQEINNFTGLFAPDGDFMAFLSAAKEIASHGSETRAGVPFSRYTFQVDGPGYAAYLRNQLEREMAAKGELPPGISLDLPRQYVDMTGTGELWLSQDGLPLRQLIHLSFPPSADQDHRLEAEIRVDFANFGQAGKTTATRDVNPTADSQQPTADSRQPMLLLIIALLLYTMLRFIRRHSRNLYMGATSVVIVSMLLSPLMQNHHVSAFYARQRAELEAQEGLQQESNMMQTLSTLYETRPGPRPAAAVSASSRRAGSASSRRAGSLALIRADDGSDADSDGMTDIGEAFLGSNPFGPDRSEQPAIIQAAAVDADGDLLPDANDPCPADPDCDDDGLTDYEETLLGTDLFSPDTDGDLISDTLEVEGFFANGQTWYSDPLEVDSNRDGLGDAQEWRFSDANWDTDGDGAPDLHDRDNDGDGVPDNLDLSPFANFPQIFSRDDPFELLVENLASRPAYIEFQLRPTNPDHLWYTYNVLDWPRYDISGQMQDEDGWTFHDYCVHNSLLQGQNLNAQCPLTPDDNGDLKLIPSLEIEFDFDSIPPTSSFFKELDAYSISRRYASDFQKATYIVPLQLVTDNQGGEQVAFYGKFFFRQSGSWGAAHKIRFAWIVQALVDNACVQQDSSGNCVLKQDNVLQPIHAYYDDWQLTGFNIQENHGTDVAQIFEDPAVDPDLQRDDALLGLANGLDQSLLAGRPNPNFPDQRNPRVLSLKIKFDHLASALQGPFRWNLPDILRVEKGTFPEGRYSHLDEAMTHLITTDTVKILDDHFTPAWTAANPITPTILVAYEEHFRAVNLDDEGGPDDPGRNTLSWNGPQLTVNMNGDGGNQVTTLASLKWTPYVYDGQAWQAAPIEDYWNELDRRYQAEFDAQNPDPEVAAGKLLITQLYYLVLFSGVQSVVQRGNSILAQNGPKTDFEIADQAGFVLGQSLQLPNEIWKALGGIKRFQVGSAANFLTSKGRSDLSAALRTSRLKTAIGVSVVAVILISLSVLGRVFAEELGLSEQASLGFKISAAVVLGLLVLSLQIIKPIITTTRLISAAGSSVLNAGDAIESRRILRSVSKGAKVLAVVGFIIDLGINWGLFFAQWLAGDIEPGTIAFNHAIAVAVGATVLALLVLALAFIPIVGPIIIAILILADIILSFFDTSLAELIADDIHGGGPLVETRARDDISNESHRPPKELVILENFGIQLVGGGSASLVDGERAQFVADITTNAYHPIPNSATAWDHTNEVWNNDTLKRSAFRYELSEGRQIRLPSLNERASDWRDIREWASVRFLPYDTTASLKSGRLSDAATSRPITLTQGINRRMGDLHFKMAYRIAAYECWGFIGYDCGVSPDNDIQTFAGSLVEPLNLILDIFPNTLDGFYALDWAGDLYDFAPHADFDGDGLMTQDDPFFGSDPDDTLWDSDGDGLSDRFELELSSLGVAFSPLLSDTDNDGLSDADELRLGDGFVVSERYRLGSNPAAADTDGDGLTDLAEVTGWQFVYAPGKVTWVTSDPAKRDSDGDGLSDKIERDLHASDPTRFPFHPRVPNEAAFIGLDYQFDAGTFYQGKPFIGSQTAAYTTTLVNQLTPVYALSGALSLSLPPALQLTGGATTNPFYLAGGETQANSFGLAAAAGAASGPVALTNQIFFQLDERGLAGWRWGLLQPNINSAAGGDYPWFSAVAPATGWSAPLLLASIEGAKVTSGTLFDTARVRVYGLNNGALGPPLTVDDDLHPDKWVDAPDIACNSAGRCLVVWSEPAAGSIQNLYGAIIDNALTVSVPRFAIAGGPAWR